VAKRGGRRKSRHSLSAGRAKNGNDWVLVHPREARECADDLDEVRTMIDAGEAELAIEELRWLLDVCHDLVEAHFLLGKLAVESQDDLPLARGHFGTAYQLGLHTLRRAGMPKPVPALHPANRSFYDAGRGLAWTLNELGKTAMAREVLEQLLDLDPRDPLGLGGWLDELNTAGATLVSLETKLFAKCEIGKPKAENGGGDDEPGADST
jgi:tetratricopeptide (TPR) repeat protein